MFLMSSAPTLADPLVPSIPGYYIYDIHQDARDNIIYDVYDMLPIGSTDLGAFVPIWVIPND